MSPDVLLRLIHDLTERALRAEDEVGRLTQLLARPTPAPVERDDMGCPVHPH